MKLRPLASLGCAALVVLLLGACGSRPAAGTPIIISRATATASATLPPTDTPTPSATPTVTPSATPSRTPSPSPTFVPADITTATYKEAGELNLRMGPGLNYPVIGRVKSGTQFSVQGRSSDAAWLQVTAPDGQIFWIFAETVESDFPPSAFAPVDVPRPPAEYLVADSTKDFSPEQGKNNWRYGASKGPNSLVFDLMPYDGRWYRWPSTAGRSRDMRISEDGNFPSRASDVMRIWTSVYGGKVRIDGEMAKESGAGRGGNGVSLRVIHRRPRSDGAAEFEREIGRWFLGAYDTTQRPYGIAAFQIEPRDELYFITSANGDDSADNTIFTGRVLLVNQGGIVLPPTFTPTPSATPSPVPPLCYIPVLRHFEPHKGCCGEIVGLVDSGGAPLGGYAVHVEGPPAGDQFKINFGVSPDGGYQGTALTWFPPDTIFYTVWLTGPNVRSEKYVVRFKTEQETRAVVDFKRGPCR